MSTPCHIIRANLNEHTRFFYLNLAYIFFKVELLKHITVHIINVLLNCHCFFKKYLNFNEKCLGF